MSILGQFQFRRDTSTNWTSVNPILLSGELGIESDTDQFKIGDGTTAWNMLPYGGIQGPQGMTGQTGAAGISPTVTVGNTTVVTPVTNPSATDVDPGPNADIRFNLPRARNVVAGTTTTGAPGTNASVTAPQDENGDVTLNFTIPRGDTGATGATGPAANSFTNIAVTGQNTVVADQANDTLTLVAGANITIVTNDVSDSITISSAAPTPANAAPPSISTTSSVGTTTNEYALEDHTHAHGNQNGGTLHALATPNITGGSAGTGGTAGFLSAANATSLANLIASGAIYNIKDFGAVADDSLGAGGTDNSTAIQNAINAAQAAGGGIVFIPAGNYSIQTGLTVRSSGVHIMGVGCGYTADVGDYRTGLVSCISWRGAAGAVMLDVFPQSGASVFPIFGFRVTGLSLDGRDLQPGPTDTGATPPAIGIRMRACSGAHLQDFFLNGPFTTAALDLGTLPPGTIGGVDSHGILRCIFERFCIRQLDGVVTPGIGLRLSGSATANVNFCKFDTFQIMYRNNSSRQPAIQLGNSDSNTFIMGACNSNGAAATNWGIEILGSATSAAEVSRANIFYHCSGGTGGIFLAGTTNGRLPNGTAEATLNFVNPSTDNQFRPISTENGEPVPVFGTGATGGYGITGGSTGPRFWAEGSSLATNVADVAIANTEARVIGFTAPANFLKSGTTFRFTAGGTFTNTTAASTSTFRIRIGTATLTGNIPAAIASVNGTTARTNIPFSIEGQVTIRTDGATGTAIGFMTLTLHNATQPVISGAIVTPVAVNTTVINQVELTGISGATTTVATFRNANIVLINQ